MSTFEVRLEQIIEECYNYEDINKDYIALYAFPGFIQCYQKSGF